MQDIGRYIRNHMIEGFNLESQSRLGKSKVAIVGAGALGSVSAMYLAAAGTGTLRIADGDKIALSNLQRQIFFKESEIGESKCRMLLQRIQAFNSDVEVEISDYRVNRDNIVDFIADSDVLIECSDNPSTKSLSVEAGKTCGIPVVLGGVFGYMGQVAVFMPECKVRYSDIFSFENKKVEAPGVFTPVPGIVASLQAAETLKLLAGLTEPTESYLLSFDVRKMAFSKFVL